MTCSSLTYTFWPHPTVQYGQTDLTTLSAVAVRGCSRAVCALIAAAPRPDLSLPVNCRYAGHCPSASRRPIVAPLDRGDPLTDCTAFFGAGHVVQREEHLILVRHM